MSIRTVSTALSAITLAASLGALALNVSPAQAAGLLDDDPVLDDPGPVYVEPAPIWTGFYLGVHAGYMWADWDGPFAYDDAVPGDGFDDSDHSLSGDDWLLGLQFGANYQFGRWVAGAEVDVSWPGAEGETSFVPYPGGDYTWETDAEMTLFGTARGRLGFLANESLLIYATGGLAWANVDSNIVAFDEDTPVAWGDADESHLGYTVGAGFEWMAATNWSFKTEYLYFDLGEEDYGYVGDTSFNDDRYATDHFEPELDGHILRIGLNYNFSRPRAPVEPLK